MNTLYKNYIIVNMLGFPRLRRRHIMLKDSAHYQREFRCYR